MWRKTCECLYKLHTFSSGRWVLCIRYIISLPFPLALILFFVLFVVVPSCFFSSVICFCLYLARVLSIITYAQHFIMKIKCLVQHCEFVCSLLIKMNNSNKAMSYCVSVFLDSIQQILSKLHWALNKMKNFLIKKCATMVFQLNQVERFWFWIELKCVYFFFSVHSLYFSPIFQVNYCRDLNRIAQ